MNRNVSLDILKLFMAFMVVGLHASFLKEFSELGSYLATNGLFRIAVPVFLIINGFYFFPVLVKNSQFSWFKRVAILYAVWMLFYIFFWFDMPEVSLLGLAKLLKSIIIGYHHLWYISGMLGAAFLLLLLKNQSTQFLLATIIISFLSGVTIQYLGNYHYFEGSTLDKLFNLTWLHRNAFLFSYPFFCIGFLINKHELYKKFSLKNAGIIALLGLSLLLLESSFNFYQDGVDGGFDNYMSLLFLCPFIFIFFSKLNIKGESKNIALYSSAIYFIHSFFLSMFNKYFDLEPTALTIACVLASTVAAYFIVKLNHRLKFIL